MSARVIQMPVRAKVEQLKLEPQRAMGHKVVRGGSSQAERRNSSPEVAGGDIRSVRLPARRSSFRRAA